MMRTMIVVLMMLCGCGARQRATDERVERLRLRIVALERAQRATRPDMVTAADLNALREEIAKAKSKISKLEVEMLGVALINGDDATRLIALEKEVVPGRIRVIGDTLNYHGAKLRRIEGLLGQAGVTAPRGWWCDDSVCGRTRAECVATAKLTIRMSGPQADGSDCRRRAKAWCSHDSEALQCQTTSCQGCVEKD